MRDWARRSKTRSFRSGMGNCLVSTYVYFFLSRFGERYGVAGPRSYSTMHYTVTVLINSHQFDSIESKLGDSFGTDESEQVMTDVGKQEGWRRTIEWTITIFVLLRVG